MDANKILGLFCQHLVFLSVDYKNAEDDYASTKRSSIPCLPCDFFGICFLLSSGHALSEIKNALSHKDIKIQRTRISDKYALNANHHESIHIEFCDSDIFFIDEDGVDFGFLKIPDLLFNNLIINKIEPIKWENVNFAPFQNYDRIVIVGIPDQISIDDVRNEEPILNPASISCSESELRYRQNTLRFRSLVCKIPDEIPLSSLSGMSGGLMFGFKADNITKYWPVAIQYSWNKGTREAFGVPISDVFIKLREWILEHEIESGTNRAEAS